MVKIPKYTQELIRIRTLQRDVLDGEKLDRFDKNYQKVEKLFGDALDLDLNQNEYRRLISLKFTIDQNFSFFIKHRGASVRALYTMIIDLILRYKNNVEVSQS